MSAPSAVTQRTCEVANGQAAPLSQVPLLDLADFQEVLQRSVEAGGRVLALYGARAAAGGTALHAAVALGAGSKIALAQTRAGRAFPSLTPALPQVHLFEREVAEQWGATPEGHPWLKPVRRPLAHSTAGAAPFFAVEGDEAHEVAVGPVHAGVIEPGHFRFQAHGERVLHLEIALGYQQRGIEEALVGGPDKRTFGLVEVVAGDTTVGHASAYCQAVEGLSGTPATPRGLALRAVALELERMANHIGDLGAMAGDVAFLPAAAWCGRLRGDYLNLTTALTGSRMGRAFVAPGGTAVDLAEGLAGDLRDGLKAGAEAAEGPIDLLWSTSSVHERFEGTGPLAREDCEALGIVGVAARASGVPRDVRREFPAGAYARAPIESRLWPTCDVFARARVRAMELEQSTDYVGKLLTALPGGEPRATIGPLAPESMVVSLVEGWRGEVCHVAHTDASGRFSRYKVVDPSFHNWMGLAMAMRGAEISDFPLVNKSFNLSYCGHDL